ncbi:MAG: hypothetical protein HJJLKODD_00281 [Phycisphaerae bacterium]|nr:hypothetical protein [Phycisphaerae bacterium]
MNARIREERRSESYQRRQGPITSQRIYFPALSQGGTIEIEAQRPIELGIEATDSQGEMVEWLTDEWWIEVQSVLRERKVTVVILPTPGALMDTVILHQLEMLRRIAHHWRLIGYAPVTAVEQMESLEAWLVSPYDEIRFSQEELARLNGSGERLISLIEQAQQSPATGGMNHTHLRIVPALSAEFRSLDSAKPPTGSSPVLEMPTSPHRVLKRNAVKSR